MDATERPIRAAVITGAHTYDVVGFTDLFRSLPGVDAYVQTVEDFAGDAARAKSFYEALVFYNCHEDTPTGEGKWFEKPVRSVLEGLGQARQGIFLLHHSILAFPKWDYWASIVGIPDRAFGRVQVGETVRVFVADKDHPITRGLPDWEIVDETYEMAGPGEDSEVLLTTDHPASMPVLAWTRRFRDARVFCFQCGHDNRAYAHPQFREVVGRGIRWCAERRAEGAA